MIRRHPHVFADEDGNSSEIKIPRAGEALAALKFCEENKK